MSQEIYRPMRQGNKYPKPSSIEWRRILRKCKRVQTGHDSPCWIFTGRIDADGYGEAKFRGAKRFTHRIAYAWRNGHAPAKRDIDHACHQRACCNPDHLDAVDPIENAGQHGDMPEQVNKHNIGLFHVGRGDSVPF